MSRKGKPSNRDFFRDLKGGDAAPVYLVHGADSFMLESAIEAVVAAALPEGPNDFNFDKFRGKDATAERIRTACETLPFMTRRRVVVVRDLQELPTAELEGLADYLDDPAPTTCLLFAAHTAARKLDGRTAAVKRLKKAAVEHEFSELREYEMPDAIDRQARALGLRLDDGARAQLIKALGTNLAEVVVALQKVDLFIGAERRDVRADDIEAIVAETRLLSVFDLTDALGARSLGGALKVLDRMLMAGESPIGVTAMVARHFRILSRLHDPAVASLPKAERARKAGVAPFFLDDYARDARRFSAAELARSRLRIVETDMALKSSKLKDRVVMERLVFDLCLGGGE